MLPAFDENGNLPPGIHAGSTKEIAQRFGIGSAEREVEIKELLQFIEWARTAGLRRVIINGSFVTEKVSPNDVDIVVLPGDSFPADDWRLRNQEMPWPFLHVIVAADHDDLADWVFKDFGRDRKNRVKGVVEVIL